MSSGNSGRKPWFGPIRTDTERHADVEAGCSALNILPPAESASVAGPVVAVVVVAACTNKCDEGGDDWGQDAG